MQSAPGVMTRAALRRVHLHHAHVVECVEHDRAKVWCGLRTRERGARDHQSGKEPTLFRGAAALRLRSTTRRCTS